MPDIDDFTCEVECIYKDERYAVRDNGAVFRYPRDGKRPRRYDNFWTFGKPNIVHGYMEIASVRIHAIVATAFLGPKPTKEHVVDHIDTNRRNNRVENLRWVTRLENILDNPITRKRIILRCGSIEAFLANPSLLRENELPLDLRWMRTVTNAEAQVSKKRLLEWAESDKEPSGGSLGAWVFNPSEKSTSTPGKVSTHDTQADLLTEEGQLGVWGYKQPSFQENDQSNALQDEEDRTPNLILSLTLGAAQVRAFLDDKPCEYPCTPQHFDGNPLAAYASNLTDDAVFWRNQDGDRTYSVAKYGYSSDGSSLIVMSRATYVWKGQVNGDSKPVSVTQLKPDEYDKNDLPCSLTEVTYEQKLFVHKRIETGFHSNEYLEEIFNQCIKSRE
jgi:hypothetical protein